jgi:hypothetical protein
MGNSMPELTLTPISKLTLTPLRGLIILCSDMECGLYEQVGGLKMKHKRVYRPGPAELGQNNWNLRFCHIYYVLHKSPYGGQF